MPPPRSPTVEHALELFARCGTPRAKRMFGGWGLYLDEIFVAVVADERLYLKADDETRPRFETTAGCERFVFVDRNGRESPMNYWTPPAEALDSPDAMTPWLRLALQAALRARAAAAGAGSPARALRPPAAPAKRPAAANAKPAATGARRRAR